MHFISFRIIKLVVWHLYYCPNANKVTLEDGGLPGPINEYITKQDTNETFCAYVMDNLDWSNPGVSL